MQDVFDDTPMTKTVPMVQTLDNLLYNMSSFILLAKRVFGEDLSEEEIQTADETAAHLYDLNIDDFIDDGVKEDGSSDIKDIPENHFISDISEAEEFVSEQDIRALEITKIIYTLSQFYMPRCMLGDEQFYESIWRQFPMDDLLELYAFMGIWSDESLQQVINNDDNYDLRPDALRTAVYLKDEVVISYLVRKYPDLVREDSLTSGLNVGSEIVKDMICSRMNGNLLSLCYNYDLPFIPQNIEQVSIENDPLLCVLFGRFNYLLNEENDSDALYGAYHDEEFIEALYDEDEGLFLIQELYMTGLLAQLGSRNALLDYISKPRGAIGIVPLEIMLSHENGFSETLRLLGIAPDRDCKPLSPQL